MKNSISSKLKSILEKGENQKVEFKESVSSGLDREMVAFANSKGGEIYIGVTDKGKVKGINITNHIKGQIESIARNCDPKISTSIKERKKEKILVISVKEGKSKPYKCSSGFYYRSGSTSQKLTTSEIREFMEREDLINFDTVRCKEFIYSKHFDKEKLFLFLDRAKVTYKKKDQLLLLKNLKVAKKIKEKMIFNNAGALFFSKNLEDIYSHTKVSCAIFRGTERIKILDRKIYNKDILSNIEDALLYLGAHLRTEYNLTGAARREEILEIPEKALREALVNAVTHRDYLNQAHVSVEIHYDRVEITNLGGLPKGLNKQNFGKIKRSS